MIECDADGSDLLKMKMNTKVPLVQPPRREVLVDPTWLWVRRRSAWWMKLWWRTLDTPLNWQLWTRRTAITMCLIDYHRPGRTLQRYNSILKNSKAVQFLLYRRCEVIDWQETVSGKRHQAASWRPRHSTSRPTTSHPHQDPLWRPRPKATKAPGVLWEYWSSSIQWVWMGRERPTLLTRSSPCTIPNQYFVGGYPPGWSSQAPGHSWTTSKSSQNLWNQVEQH